MQRSLSIAFALMLPSMVVGCGWGCTGGPEDTTDEVAIDVVGFSSQDVIDRLPKEELAIEIMWQPAQDLLPADGDVWGVETLPTGSSVGTLQISPTGGTPQLTRSSGRRLVGTTRRDMTKREFAKFCEDMQWLEVPTQVALSLDYNGFEENSKADAVARHDGLDEISIRLGFGPSPNNPGGIASRQEQPPFVSVPEGFTLYKYVFDIELGGESPQGTVQAIISNDATHLSGTFVIGTWKTVATT